MHVLWSYLLCLLSYQSEFMALFCGFNLWNVPGFFLVIGV
jgi:hypothetical protein